MGAAKIPGRHQLRMWVRKYERKSPFLLKKLPRETVGFCGVYEPCTSQMRKNGLASIGSDCDRDERENLKVKTV